MIAAHEIAILFGGSPRSEVLRILDSWGFNYLKCCLHASIESSAACFYEAGPGERIWFNANRTYKQRIPMFLDHHRHELPQEAIDSLEMYQAAMLIQGYIL